MGVIMPFSSSVSYLLVVFAGACVALQQVLLNLRAHLGSPWWAGSVSYLVGLIAMLAVALIAHQVRDSPSRLLAVTPWLSWMGAFFGAIFIGFAVLMVPRLRAATTIALIVVGQMLGSLAFDHFGVWVYRLILRHLSGWQVV